MRKIAILKFTGPGCCHGRCSVEFYLFLYGMLEIALQSSH